MKLSDFRKQMLPAIEESLQAVVDRAGGSGTEELKSMLCYHLGWKGEGAGKKAQGKRIRPLLVLLACSAAGGNWEDALPAAASVELLHNFSLIHDDIQDDSEYRRGRPTLWSTWGIPQAINAGDSMFSLAHSSLESLSNISDAVYTKAIKILPVSSLKLTQGQYMDLAFETQEDISLNEYWDMAGGKTAVLLSTCCRLGAIVGGASTDSEKHYGDFGEKIGLAFQVHDDVLGIWGSQKETGKSNHSDLMSGKKSLPVIYGMNAKGNFARMWADWNYDVKQFASIALALEKDGAKKFAEEKVSQLTEEALQSLENAKPEILAGQALKKLAIELVDREF